MSRPSRLCRVGRLALVTLGNSAPMWHRPLCCGWTAAAQAVLDDTWKTVAARLFLEKSRVFTNDIRKHYKQREIFEGVSTISAPLLSFHEVMHRAGDDVRDVSRLQIDSRQLECAICRWSV